jgi:glyoxylase-like metal-dependent hydrolase (beta-lactamase superfamily II)
MILFENPYLHIAKEGPLGPWANNSYVIVDRQLGESIMIDAPQDVEKALAAAEGTRLTKLLITHSHGDHTAGIQTVKEQTGAQVYCHPDEPWLPADQIDVPLADGDEIRVGDQTLKVILTPGHTPGSTCFLLGDRLFSGDTLFPGGPGRTQTHADLEQEIVSITSRLHSLPDTTHVHPGHGDDTTIAVSKEEYAVFAGKEHDPDLHGDVLWLES